MGDRKDPDFIQSELNEQVVRLASRHGTKMVEAALHAARRSRQVMRRDEALGDTTPYLHDYSRTIDVPLRMDTDRTPSDIFQLSSALMEATIHNRSTSRVYCARHVKPIQQKIDIIFSAPEATSMTDLEGQTVTFCQQSVNLLRNYSGSLQRNNNLPRNN